MDFEAMNNLLKLIWDKTYPIEDNQLLPVLQASCMLQFLEIKEICSLKVEESINTNNCLKIWFFTQQLDLTNIYKGAKLCALLHFKDIKESETFLDLSLEEICAYLGSINLQVSNEIDVFHVIFKWYQHQEDKSTSVFLRLLFCLDFNNLDLSEISKLINYEEISEIFKCIISLKQTPIDLPKNFNQNIITQATALLKSSSRNFSGFPCIMFHNLGENYTDKGDFQTRNFELDQFKRKRPLQTIDDPKPTIYLISIGINKILWN